MASNLILINGMEYMNARKLFSRENDIFLYELDEHFETHIGLCFCGSPRASRDFKFKIVDEQKWLLAKIKYGFQ